MFSSIKLFFGDVYFFSYHYLMNNWCSSFVLGELKYIYNRECNQVLHDDLFEFIWVSLFRYFYWIQTDVVARYVLHMKPVIFPV